MSSNNKKVTFQIAADDLASAKLDKIAASAQKLRAQTENLKLKTEQFGIKNEELSKKLSEHSSRINSLVGPTMGLATLFRNLGAVLIPRSALLHQGRNMPSPG